MAAALGHDGNRYAELRDKGKVYLENQLWNGEYFIQEIVWEGLNAGTMTGSTVSNNTFADIWSNAIHFFGNGNTVFRNNFIHCEPPLENCENDNQWHNNNQGNYYSDYLDKYPGAGENTDIQSVWDTPYGIRSLHDLVDPFASFDEFPLMNRIYTDTVVPLPGTPWLQLPVENAHISDDTVSFIWNSASGARSYRLQVSPDTSFTTPYLNDGTLQDTCYTFCGLEMNKSYYWRVLSENSGMISGWSDARYFFTGTSFHIVSIPDTAFLYALLDEGVDGDGDSLISQYEAEAVMSLDVSDRGISDMTGIEAFVNLDTLDCSGNAIDSLDVSMNVAITDLACGNNALNYLDLSHNTALASISIDEMPSLTCVCVWETPFPPEGVEVDTTGSPNVYFAEECAVGKDKEESSAVMVYPNPAIRLLNVEMKESGLYTVVITSLTGQNLLKREICGSSLSLDISSFQTGVYFISVSSGDFIFTRKFVKD
jgi:hypothetical protein